MTKRLFSIITILTVLFVSSSCEGPMGPQGQPGEGNNWKIIPLDAQKGRWQWDNEEKVYFQEFSLPELTKFIAEEGHVGAAIREGDTFFPLEYTFHFKDENSGKYYSETVKYDYWPGHVRINVSGSDIFDDSALDYQPQTYQIKITLLW